MQESTCHWNSSSVCVVDASGKIVREGKVASEPEALIAWFGSLGVNLERIGLEAGPLSQWLYAAMREAGLAVELLETRHVKAALRAMPVKTRPQRRARHCATDAAGLVPPGALQVDGGPGGARAADRAQAGAIEAVRHRDEPARHSARLRAQGWADHVAALCSTDQRELVDGQPSLEVVAAALLSLHAVLLREFASFEKSVRPISRADARVRLLMSTPGVGAIVALTYVSAIDDPARFPSSKSVGAHFGLTPKKYQSGETDVTGRISKIGDGSVRTALYEAAHVILTRPIKGGALKSWAMKLARRAGMKKAKVALARKLAVVLHRMWVDAIKFDADKASGCVRVAA